ncbi:MAG: hypothetical protein CMK82_11110 [Pseudomonadales bacterium]|uniref:hypothetical protein n=1 Tax=Sphingobium sp. TaxID=1912891 RepID=UPI000C92A75D|nr:hypothetical protein [Sphingobium sp.]MAS67328.1 hypothetical protein [Pseudomonadales bacterium]
MQYRAWGLSVSAQIEFDKKYITTTEVCLLLKVHRTTVLLALRTGRLPEAVTIRRPNGEPQIMLWERDAIAPYLAEWSKARAERASA